MWDDLATPAVLVGLRHEQWRVAEMCVKVAGLRDLGQGGDAVAALAGHDLARVRLAVVRALRDIGDTEHVPTVDDPEEAVRGAAHRALGPMRRRLDLVDWR